VETHPPMTGQIDELISLFNRRSEDLPDKLFDRHTQFLLNGVPFEEMLGRSSSDPLVLMLARGPAGYRFTFKALLHAMPDARIERGDIATSSESPHVATWHCWLSGHLRGTGEAMETVFGVTFQLAPTGQVQRASVTIEERHLAGLREARKRP
jgi:hypothetical protein